MFLHVDEDAVIRATAAELRMPTARVADIIGCWAENYGRSYMAARKALRMAQDEPTSPAEGQEPMMASPEAQAPAQAAAKPAAKAPRKRTSPAKAKSQPDGTAPPPAEVPRMTAPDDDAAMAEVVNSPS